ncbi:ImmA/IrrE family metallo-endopeptidase [Burkholderia sp. SIMBA_062]|uniref:ImmA/IrrE family metallo-endopeptidase n=1 Tax=Burkholderia sp. SIMBA_062 TaxID=3085803 RepID=UPI003979B5B5
MPAINPMQALYSRLSGCGINRKFAKRLLPEWWDDSIAENPSGLLQAQIIIAHSLNLDLNSLRDPGSVVQFRSAQRKFKHSKAVDKVSIQLSAEYATGMAKLAVQAMETPFSAPPRDAIAIRNTILKARPQVDLEGLLAYCSAAGIAVLHIGELPGKKMDAVAVKQAGRAAIVLSRKAKSSYLLFHLAHEIGHIAMGHLGDTDGTLIDAAIVADGDADEREADKFAIQLLNGSEVKYTSKNRFMTGAELAAAAVRLGAQQHIDAGHIVLNYGHVAGNFPLANAAMGYLPGNQSGPQLVNSHLRTSLNWQDLSEDQAALLDRALTP